MSVEKLLKELGIEYRVINDEAYSACPFHSPDHHPSWYVNLRSGLHHCFSCGAKGNLAYLIHHVHGGSYASAVIQANEIAGFARIDEWRENFDNVSFSPPAIKVSEADMALFTDPPQHALDSRYIKPDSAKRYGIMWNPEHESWIFPYRDPYSSELWGWQEKNARIFRNFPAGTKRGKTLFGIDKLFAGTVKPALGGEAILVESPVDCAVLYNAGYENAVSSFGIPSLYQFSLLQWYRTNSIILALDNDKAGVTATKELIPTLLNMFCNVTVLPYMYTKAKDVGEMEHQSIRTEIDEAMPALAWLRRHNDS